MNRIALVGHGRWGKIIYPHIPCGCTITDIDSACGDKDTEGIIIATHPDTHLRYAAKAIEHGKHVWIEKGTTGSYTDACAVARQAKAKGVTIFPDFVYLFASPIRWFISSARRTNRPKTFSGAIIRSCNQGDPITRLAPHLLAVAREMQLPLVGLKRDANRVTNTHVDIQTGFASCYTCLEWRDTSGVGVRVTAGKEIARGVREWLAEAINDDAYIPITQIEDGHALSQAMAEWINTAKTMDEKPTHIWLDVLQALDGVRE